MKKGHRWINLDGHLEPYFDGDDEFDGYSHVVLDLNGWEFDLSLDCPIGKRLLKQIKGRKKITLQVRVKV